MSITATPTELINQAPINTASFKTAAVSPTISIDNDRPTPFVQLVRTELRKMRDTRSGAAVALAAALLTIAVPVIQLIMFHNHPSSLISYGMFVDSAKYGISLLVPIMAILLVTSEWSQRTGLMTFTLTPHRGRVVSAKLTTVIVATLIACAGLFAVTAVANVATLALGSSHVIWDLSAMAVLMYIATSLAPVLTGFALGTALLNSPAAIVAYFVTTLVLPPMISALAVFKWFSSIAPWIDSMTNTLNLTMDPTSASHWTHFGVSLLFWAGIPLAIGATRILRTEIK